MTDETLANVTRAAHDWGLASWLGGSMFGSFALNPTVRRLPEPADRGRIVNAAWNAYNAINAVSLAAVAAGWVAARFTEARPDRLTRRERWLAVAKDVFTGSAVVSGVASGVEGARLARQAPEGAVPIETGTRPGAQTPPQAASIQRALGRLRMANIGAGVGIVIANALLAQEAHSRPPARRSLLRRGS